MTKIDLPYEQNIVLTFGNQSMQYSNFFNKPHSYPNKLKMPTLFMIKVLNKPQREGRKFIKTL